jgi:hypothetical protein
MREYLMVIVGSRRPLGWRDRARAVAAVSLVGGRRSCLFGLTFLLQQRRARAARSLQEPTLERVQYLRQTSRSAPIRLRPRGRRLDRGGARSRSSPIGLTYFLLAPVPVERHQRAAAGDAPRVDRVVRARAVRLPRASGSRSSTIPRAYTVLVAVLATVTFSYALVEGNVGTAYRHRAQVLPLFFVPRRGRVCATRGEAGWSGASSARREGRAVASLQARPGGRATPLRQTR